MNTVSVMSTLFLVDDDHDLNRLTTSTVCASYLLQFQDDTACRRCYSSDSPHDDKSAGRQRLPGKCPMIIPSADISVTIFYQKIVALPQRNLEHGSLFPEYACCFKDIGLSLLRKMIQLDLICFKCVETTNY